MEKHKIKVVLFDLDGLVIVGRKRFFSERLSAEHGIPLEAVQEFFLNDLKSCTFGKADLKEVIAPYLTKWGWKGTVDDLLEYWFSSESTKDEDVLAIVGKLRAHGVKCYIATRQEKYRMAYLEDVVGLKSYFDGTFVTYNIGCDKSQPEFFQYVLKDLDVRPEEVLFFDDTQKNVDVAKELGISAHFYDGIQVLKGETDEIVK